MQTFFILHPVCKILSKNLQKVIDLSGQTRYNRIPKKGVAFVKQPIHLWDARHPKEREAFLYIPLLALGLTLISELFNHKAFTDGPSSFWQFVTVFQTGIDTLPNYLSTPYIILLVGAILLVLAGLVFLFWKGPRSTASGRRRLMTGTAALAVSSALLAGSWTLAFHLGSSPMCSPTWPLPMRTMVFPTVFYRPG